MKCVMVDLETTGLDPHHNAIIQLAACKFDLKTGEVDTNFFNQCLLVPENRYWQESTYQWWGKRVDTYRSIQARMRDPRQVMLEFIEWLGPEQMKFVGKPTHFDYVFLESYIKQFLNRPTPFHYRYAEDMNSWIRGRYFPNDPPDLHNLLPMDGTGHDAIFDVLHQIKIMLYVAKETTRPAVELLMPNE